MDGGRSAEQELEALREMAQSIVDRNGDLADCEERANTLAERYLALHERLAAAHHGTAAIVRLREGDPLPPGARFCQIVGSVEEPIGASLRTRRVYLVLVEGVSSDRE